MRQYKIFVIFLICCANFSLKVNSMRTATVVAPEFIHSGRKYSLSLATNNLKIPSQFEVTIESLNFKESRAIHLQPNGVQIVEFDLPTLQRDEYVLRVMGKGGIFSNTATRLKFATFKPIFVIQTDKKLYHRGESLHYRILCLDENLRPIEPESSVSIRVTSEAFKIVYNKDDIKFDNYVSSGELYVNNIVPFGYTTLRRYKARLGVFMQGELFTEIDVEILDDEIGDTLEKEEETSSIKVCHTNQYKHDYLSIIPQRIGENETDYFKVSLSRSHVGKIIKQSEIVTFIVNSSMSFSYLVYTIIGRGNVVQSQRIEFEEEKSEFHFQFKPTNEMAPLGKLVIYSIDADNNFHYDEASFNVEGQLQNKLVIKTPQQIKLNKKLELEIETAPNSFVGILAIEELNNELKMCNEDLNDVNSLRLLKNFAGNRLQRGEITGNIILTTAYNLQYKPERYNKVWTENDVNIFQHQNLNWRKSWLFADIANTTSDTFILRHNLPNEDANWRVTAFSLHATHGLGFTELQPPLRTSKSYNVSFEVADSVSVQEILCIALKIENFLDEEIQIVVEFDRQDYDIELLPIFESESNGVKTVEVAPKSKVELKYAIRSKVAGEKLLKFLFFSTAGNDREIINLNVKATGLAYSEQQFHIIDLQNSTEFTKSIGLDDQQAILPDTQFTTIELYANLLGPVFTYLKTEKFHFEHFTGEQTASVMAMACLSLRYLNSSMPDFEKDLNRLMHQAYLHLLYYNRQENGAFSFFSEFKTEQTSNWLTAYILTWLPCVKQYFNVDETIVEAALDYLATTQKENGSFQATGATLNGRANNDSLAITAHILLAYTAHENYYDIYKTVMEKSTKYILDNHEKSEFLYVKALAMYALYKVNYSDLENEVSKFKSLLRREDDYEFWAEGNYKHINNIATTTFIMLASIGRNINMEVSFEKCIKWLLEKGTLYHYRGLYPLQTTVLTLEVLILFMQTKNFSTNIDITLSRQGVFQMEHTDFALDANDILNSQHFEFNSQNDQVELNAIGEGYALAQMGFNYNIQKAANEGRFEITIEHPTFGNLVSFMITICIQYESFKHQADLVIVEVASPSGYIINREYLVKLIESQSLIKHALIDAKGNFVKLLLVDLPRYENKCLSLELLRVHAIANHASVPVVCYEYTDPSNMDVFYYRINSSVCDLCEGETECIRYCASHS